jgi:1,4-alpha-glucan branching enzyme
MGNEFGHPEWIDFPRAGNDWSFRYARRQWDLVDNANLKYRFLARFDRDMIHMAKACAIFKDRAPQLLHDHGRNQVIAFARAGLILVFNFHPTVSHSDYRIDAPPGKYRVILDSDSCDYHGRGRLRADQAHFTLSEEDARGVRHRLSLYLPTRTALVLQKDGASKWS